jgi:hypothetical protein
MTGRATRAARLIRAPRVVRIVVGTGIARAPDVPMTVPVTKAAATAVRTAGPTQGAPVSCRTAVGRPDATHAARTGPTRVPAGTRSARQAVGPMPATAVGASPEAARMTVRRPVRRCGAVPSATIAPSAAATATAATTVRATATIVPVTAVTAPATTTTVRATAMTVPATAATTPGATARSAPAVLGRSAGPAWTARARPPSVAARLTATAPKSPAQTRWSGQLPR